jgi:thioredoxin
VPEILTTVTFKEKVFDYDKSREWKYEGKLPCIVDFYADWCGPCKMVAPVLEQIAKDYEGRLLVYKVNTDEQQELAGAFGIQSIPSLLFVPKEGRPQMAQGALPRTALEQAIREVLAVEPLAPN